MNLIPLKDFMGRCQKHLKGLSQFLGGKGNRHWKKMRGRHNTFYPKMKGTIYLTRNEGDAGKCHVISLKYLEMGGHISDQRPREKGYPLTMFWHLP